MGWPDTNNAQYTPMGQPINYGGNVNMAMYPGPVSDTLGAGIGGLSMVPMPQAPQMSANYGSNASLYAPQKLVGPNGAIVPSGGGGGMGAGLGKWFSNGENLGVAIQGFSALAGAYLGFQQMKAAKDGLKFQKEAFNANLGNSIKTYNTSLEDRINGRTSDYDGKSQDVAAYLAKHSLKR